MYLIRRVIFLVLLSVGLNAFSQSIEQLPEPYRNVKLLPFDGHGWYINAVQMEMIFKKYSPKIVIEVGSWLGCSTRHIATLLPNDGIVYAVDHWLGSAEHRNDQRLNTLYDQFLSNVIHAGLTNKIIPVRMDSLNAARTINVTPDLIYIDASHDYASVYEDLSTWFPFVQGHGVLCGDDWGWKTVRNAVIVFATDQKLQVKAEGNFWYLEE